MVSSVVKDGLDVNSEIKVNDYSLGAFVPNSLIFFSNSNAIVFFNYEIESYYA